MKSAISGQITEPSFLNFFSQKNFLQQKIANLADRSVNVADVIRPG